MKDRTIERLKNDSDFQTFLNWMEGITQKLEDVSDIKNLESLDNARAGEEAKIKKQAADTLRFIIRKFDPEEDGEPSYEEIKKAKKRLGL